MGDRPFGDEAYELLADLEGSTPEPSASSTVRLGTPTCSDASARDRCPLRPQQDRPGRSP
jgi:hypothetical protein